MQTLNFSTGQRLAGLIITSVLLASGCASMSESQCVAGDWETVGYRDGLAGAQSSKLMKHQNACVKHGVTPDREAYLAGWDNGVRQFCLPENAFNAGESGRSFSNVCPEELQASFHAAYQEGRQLYLAKSEISTLNRQIAQKESRLKQIAKEITAAEAVLVEGASSTAERMTLLDQTKELAEEKGQLEAEIQDMKVDVAVKSERLKNLRQTLAYAY